MQDPCQRRSWREAGGSSGHAARRPVGSGSRPHQVGAGRAPGRLTAERPGLTL